VDAFWLILIVYVAIVLVGRSQQQKRRGQGAAGGEAKPHPTSLRDLQLMLQGQEPPTDDARALAERLRVRLPAAPAPPREDAAEPVVDYDAESIRIAEQRRRAAETPAFLPERARQGPGPKLTLRAPPTTAVASRIESRIVDRVVAPPGAAADATAARAATPVPGASSPAAARLARYADGSLRGAFVLSEILGKPRGGA
jgi:hypothetical protein